MDWYRDFAMDKLFVARIFIYGSTIGIGSFLVNRQNGDKILLLPNWALLMNDALHGFCEWLTLKIGNGASIDELW